MKFNNIRLLVIGLLFILSVQDSKAQDALFSQFYNNPVYNNPAFTGVHNGRFRVVAGFRDQWNAVSNTTFRTSNVNFDMRSKIGRGDFLTYGFKATNDQSGDANLTYNEAGFNLGYMKQLSGNRFRRTSQYLTGGISLSVGQLYIKPDRLWFSNQFSEAGQRVDNTIDSGEDINDSTNFFPDFTAGILYYGVNGDNSYYFGAAAHHLNQPNVSLRTSGQVRKYARYTVQAGGQIAISNTTQLLPAVIVNTQGPSLAITSGLNFRYSNRDWREVAIRMGSYLSLAKQVENGAYLPWLNTAFVMELENVFFGISYDISMGALSVPTDSRGAFEITVGYIKSANYRARLKCPKL
jgi:type IX secretion system PorP/SprF family membrane protein